MFILKGIEQPQNAIDKARKTRLTVKFRSFGNYSVRGSKGWYTVICRKDEKGNKTVACECKGAEKGLVCYHSAAALAVHTGIAKQRQQTA
ncbi:MAG TPA: hypothetical protein VF721_14335 [Pyrinomonadaceae bacterium]|jgi:hypothetical protein